LLSGQNKPAAQLFLVDLITHSWRTWDSVQKWAIGFPSVQPIISAANAKSFSALPKWGDVDPLYQAMVEKHPNPEAKP
jgi:hypothetical protein